MLVESSTGISAFTQFGGIGTLIIRDGSVRCQGPFRQAITAGAFGATMALYFAAHIFASPKRIKTYWLGFLASVAILATAHSSGPILGFLIGLLCLALWRTRTRLRKIRWGISITLIALHLTMKAPVWFLVARLGDLIGGGGYHRAYLIDRFLNSFEAWALLGTADTSSWFPYQLATGTADITNQFVSDGLNGGLLGLFFAVFFAVNCFRNIGASLRTARDEGDFERERNVWGIGSVYTGSIGILFSVTYFDQMHVVWYFLLACIAAVTSFVGKSGKRPASPTSTHFALVRGTGI
jgi:hypothetical protein